NFDMEEEEEQFEDVLNSGFKLYKELHDQLYDYQLSGLVFLYKAYEQGKKGVILADEMGLGKSIQVITFLSGMMDTEQIKNVLLVMPITLKKDWTDKLNKWTPGIKWQFYHKTEENSTRNLRNVQMGGDVLLTSYRMLVHHQTSLSRYKNKPFTWDCVIYDEAHELKNHTTKTFMAATAIPAKFKILLTGMPVQSKLQELWALFSIVAPSGLLGSYNDYKKLYKDPITRATEAYASPRERTSGKEILWRLQKKIEPYFLRRTKDKILHSKNSCRLVQLNCKETPHLPKKTELVVWIRLSPEQETMYRELILSRGPLNKACYSLQDVNTLKSICNHPRQLEENYLHHLPTDILLAESGKLTFLISLLRRLMEDGHRILVFSQFPKMLDIIQYVLEKKKLGPFLRIDGKTHLQERERQCELFQENSCYKIFFFTTKVGAIGLTLTSASRVVIVDPSWNQEVDSQAVNQAYRIGQKEKVVVYRLITCGTVEEKMYRKQVFRSALWKNKNLIPHFTKDDLRELLPLGETRFSVTQRLLDTDCLRPHQSMDEDLKFHETFLRTLNVCSISDYRCLSSTKQVEDLMEEIETVSFRVKSDAEKNMAEGKIQKKKIRGVRASLGQIGTKKVLKKHANHRKSSVIHERKYAVSPYSSNRQRRLLKKKLFYDLEDGSYEHSDRQSMDSNNTDCRTNTENINTVIKTCRLGNKKKGYNTASNSVDIYNFSCIADDSISDTTDNMACSRATELEHTRDLKTEDADETAFDSEIALTPLTESKAQENRQLPSFTVSSSPYLKSNVMDHLVREHQCSPQVALNSPEHPSQCGFKLHGAIRGLCDYSLTPSSMSPSCLLSEHEYSDQGGSSSKAEKVLRKQSREEEIESTNTCGYRLSGELSSK
ncbi:DNA excision repair protein ERCC-6-like, partial [Scleropages formosus]|uniref:DNA excision repair protein ERCC-6-like n=1 Tax=Scleropages formosus TaxID=113540 RepID=UPI0008791218